MRKGYYINSTFDFEGKTSNSGFHWNTTIWVSNTTLFRNGSVPPESIFIIEATENNDTTGQITWWWNITDSNCTDYIKEISSDTSTPYLPGDIA